MAEYQFQIDAGYAQNRENGEKTSPEDLNITTLNAIVYFDPVSVDNLPVRLAPFIGRNSSVSVGGQVVDEPFWSDARNRTFHGAAVDVQIGDTPLRLGAGWVRAGGLGAQHLAGRPDAFDQYMVSVGWYLLDNGLLSYQQSEYERKDFPFFAADVESEASEWRYRQILSTSVGWLDASAFYSERELDQFYQFFADLSELKAVRFGGALIYYPVAGFGVGVTLAEQEEKYESRTFTFADEAAKEVGLVMNYDPSEAFGLSAFYVHKKTKIEPADLAVMNGWVTDFGRTEVNERLVGATISFRF